MTLLACLTHSYHSPCRAPYFDFVGQIDVQSLLHFYVLFLFSVLLSKTSIDYSELRINRCQVLFFFRFVSFFYVFVISSNT